LDGQPVMAMFRRLPRSTTALDQTKQELARQESELREQTKKLERMIADAPRIAEEVKRRQREELVMRANQGGSRLDLSMVLQDKRYGESGSGRRRGSLRKERREGRIVFLVLIVALLAAAIWLLSHLHF
jgi:septal ring factor EnvC (AmiA/AmiB activator)